MGDMERAQAPITNKGMEDDSFRWAFETTARAMPDLALGTLFTMAATPVGGAAYFGAMQAGDTYDQTLHSMLAKGHTMEEAKSAAAKAAAGAGTVTAGTSMVTGRAISGRVLPAGVQQKLGGSIAGRMMGSKAGQYGEAMVGEAVQESLESLGTDVSRALAEKDESIMKGAGKRMKEAAVAGALFGGTMETMGSSIRAAQQSKFNYEMAVARKGAEAASASAELASTPEGMQKLQTLGAKQNPTRKDFIEAGFSPDLRLNRKQRQQVADMFHPDNIATAERLKQDIDQQKEAEAARQQGEGAPEAEGEAGEPMMSTGQPAAPEAMVEEAGEARVSKIGQVINDMFTKSGIGAIGQAIDQTFDSPFYRSMKEKGKKTAAGLFKSRGMLQEDAFQTVMQREFDVKAEAKRTEFALTDFSNGIKKVYGTRNFDKIADADRALLRDAIGGNKDAQHKLKDDIRRPIQRMRARIDELSKKLVESGAIEGELEVLMGDQFMDTMFEKAGVPGPVRRKINKPGGEILGGQGMDTKLEALAQIRRSIQEGEPNAEAEAVEFLTRAGVKEKHAKTIVTVIANDGIYLNRSYRAFDDPEWSHRVDPAVRNRAKAWLRKQHPKMTDEKAEQVIKEILFNAKESQNPIRFIANNVSAGRTALMERKDLAFEIRELLGQYDSPELNFAKTVRNLSGMLANHKMMNDLRSLGLEHGFMSKDDPNVAANSDHTVAFDTEIGGRYSPLRGMRTTPEIKAAIDGMTQGLERLNWDNPLYNAYRTVEGFSQRAKTSLSVQAMLRQVPSNMLIALSNGHSPTAFLGHINDMFKDVTRSGDGPWRDRILEGVQHGVIGENVDMNMIADLKGRKMLQEVFEDMTSIGEKNFMAKAWAKLGAMDRLYAGMDTMFKMAAWEIETARYAKAKGIDLKDGDPDQIAALKRQTASLVRDTNPTYSLIPHLLKEYKKTPFGSFISFQTEVIRNQANTMRLAMAELSDPQLRGVGATRLMGFLSAKAVVPGFMAAGYFLSGMGVEDDDALRTLVAHYHKNTYLTPLGRKNGDVKFADLGYVDPVGFAGKSLIGILHGANPREKMMEAVGEFMNPYASTKLLYKYIHEATAGVTDRGRELYGPTDTEEVKFAKGAAHVINKALMPGTAQSLIRLGKSLADYRGPGNVKYSFVTEVSSIVGARSFNLNVPNKLERATFAFKDDAGDVTANYKRALNREGMRFPGELERAYNDMRFSRQKLFDEIQEVVEASQQLYPDIDVESILRKGGLSEGSARSVMDGVYEEYIPSTLDHLDKTIELATPEHKVKLEEARAKKVRSLVYAATGPGNSEDTAEAAQESIEVLQKRGVPKQEVFDHLVDRLLEYDRREDVKALKKIAKENGLTLTEEEFAELAKERVTQPKWTDSRKDRVRRINWYRD
jgi:hypothetical protein